MPRPKQRTPQLRERVLHTAVGVLAADGLGGFTTRRIAEEAQTSTPAVYELFGDRAGLVREIFFEGFRKLRAHFDDLVDSNDPLADIAAIMISIRHFVRANPQLAEVMFSRPFADFDPGPEERLAGTAVREFVVGRVRRCVDAGLLAGNETDIAHVLLALAQGLAVQETAGWLGTSDASVERRWALGIDAAINGLRPAAEP